MKILFLTANLKEIGGIQQYNRDLLKALNDLGENIKIVELEKSFLLAKIKFAALVIFKAINLRPDIILCSHINFSPICFFLKKIFNFDYFIFTYGIEVWNMKSDFKIKALKNAKIAITVSKFTAQKLKEQAIELRDKIFLLPNAINAEQFYPREKPLNLLSKYKLFNNNKIILTVARLSDSEKYKGYDNIIKAMPSIIKEIPDARYLIVGSGDDLERIKKLISDLKLKDYVVLTGSIPLTENIPGDLMDYYNLSDVFVMPSKGEGFGFVFLEALACGKPVIAGNVAGATDAILNGKLGILINPDNINEISNVIIKIFKKEVSANLLDSDYLRKNVLEAYGFDKFKEKVSDLLTKI